MNRLLLWVGCLTFVSGCASLDGLEKPDVALVDLQMGQVTMLETTARATLRLDNENLVPLQVEGGVYKLYINGKRIGKGLSDKHFEIPKLNSVTQDVVISLDNLALARRIISIINSEQLVYGIQCVVHIRLDGRMRAIKINRSGQLDRSDLNLQTNQ
jgi:LEA14-like dessication related protein